MLYFLVFMNMIDIYNIINKVYNGMNCIFKNFLFIFLIEFFKENKYKFDSVFNWGLLFYMYLFSLKEIFVFKMIVI